MTSFATDTLQFNQGIFMRVFGLLVSFAAMLLSGCSTMSSTPVSGGSVQLTANGPYAVVVNAGGLSPIVYEFAVREFGIRLPVTETNDAKGRIEVTFSTSTDGVIFSTASTTSTSSLNANVWYSRNSAVASGSAQTYAVAASTTGALTWQNSSALVVIRDKDGKRLWSADYAYKGGWELSGFYVNTPEEAARFCVKKLREQLERDQGRR